MPVWIRRRAFAGRVENGNLLFRQRPIDRAEIGAELFFVTRADDDVAHRGTRQQPIDRDLRNRLSGFAGNTIQRVDDGLEILVVDRRSVISGRV
jgi:hypothetical protein